MILDGLPLELMREVLLDLPEVDIIQTVKCTRRLYQFAKIDKALGRRLQNRVSDLDLCLGGYSFCWACNKMVMGLTLATRFREIDNAAQWSRSNFYFWFEGVCKCLCRRASEIEPGLLDHPSLLYDNHLLRGFENGTKFIIKNDSLDDAVINCAKLFNILMKFCIVRKFKLRIHDNVDHRWDKMRAFFNTNPPDVRIQPRATIDSRINLDSFSIFPNGLSAISVHSRSESISVDAYHEVFRKTPIVSFFEVDLPYAYEDLFGFFKDTKKLSLWFVTRITKQEICQIVQNFYEVKHDEECFFEIVLNGDFLAKDFLTLIPEEAYSLQLKRSGVVSSELETRTWAEMTDKFGGKWDLMNTVYRYWGTSKNSLCICSVELLDYQPDFD